MPAKRRIAIGSDHAGYALKELLKNHFPDVDWVDLGPNDADRTDYPDYAEKVARQVSSGKAEQGVLVCGSGIGMAIAANKVPGVRAAVVESELTARLARSHNDANVLCLGARILAPDHAKSILETWLKASFEGGRHADRVRKITQLENKADDSAGQRKKSAK